MMRRERRSNEALRRALGRAVVVALVVSMYPTSAPAARLGAWLFDGEIVDGNPVPDTVAELGGDAALDLRLGSTATYIADTPFAYEGNTALDASVGINERAFHPDDETFSFLNTDTFSLQAWFKMTTNSGARSIVTKRWAQFGDGYILGVTTDNRGIFFVEGDDDTQVATGGPALDDGQWHFAVGTYDPNDGPDGTMKLYVDGQLVGQDRTVSKTIVYQSAQGFTKFCIARGCDIGGTQRNPFFGLVDEVAVWDEVRQPADVLADFENSLFFSASSPLLGDANNDDQVTGGDLISVQQNFGNDYTNGACDGLGLGDANDDCLVTGGDLISVQQNFGKTQNTAAVPEPLSALLLILPAAVALRRHRPASS